MKRSSSNNPQVFPEEADIPGYLAPGRLLGAMAAAHAVTLLLMGFWGYDLTRFGSLLSVSSSALAGLLVFSALYVKRAFGKKAVYIICAAFLLKVFVGIWHYLSFFDPDYFRGLNGYSYFLDFEWMHRKMMLAADYWREEGFSQLPASFYLGNKNPFLLAYNGVLYFLSGNNHLNIAPWNALHSIYVAILIGGLALRLGATKKQATFALALAAFQPFGFISNIMWRDSAGQAWLVLGVFMIIITENKKYLWPIILPLACFLAWSQRQPYLLVMLGLAAYMLAGAYREKGKGWLILGCFATAAACFVFLPDILGMALGRFQGTQQLVVSPFTFPLRILRALAGPFPWYQVFMGVDGVEYMPLDFLQAVYNLALIWLSVPLVKKMWIDSGQIELGFLVCAMVFLSAAQAVGVHLGYVSIGMVFLIPIISSLSPAKWYRTFYLCFVGFLIANLGYAVLGFAGSGLVMGITGY